MNCEGKVKHINVKIHTGGHIILSGKSGSARQCIVRLTAFIYKMNISILDSFDITSPDQWRRALRQMLRKAGMEDCPYLLYVIPGSENCEEFLRVLTTLTAHGMDPMLLEEKEIALIERKNAAGLDKIAKNILKNLHLVFAMDLDNPEVSSLAFRFPFLMSKFVTDHMKCYAEEDYEEMASMYLDDNCGDIDLKGKENWPAVITKLFMCAKASIRSIHGMELITSSSFCNFLKELNELVRRKLEERNTLQANIEKIFENHSQVEDLIAKLHEQSSEIKTRINANQKINDELLIQQMQVKRDYEDIQKKLSEESKKATEEKTIFLQIESNLQTELQQLWDPIEKAKQFLKELTSEDVDEMLNGIGNKGVNTTFLDAAKILFAPEEEFSEKIFGTMINSMLDVAPDGIPDAKIFSFVEFLAKNKPRQDIINKVESIYIAESIKLWCLAMEAFGRAKKSGNQKRQKCEQIKKRYETRLDTVKDIKASLDKVENVLEGLEENINKVVEEMEADTKEIDDIENRIEKAEKIRRLLSADTDSYKLTHSRLDDDIERIIGNSFLTSAFLAYFGPFSSSQRRALWKNWMDALTEADIKYDQNLNYLDYVEGKKQLNSHLLV